MQLDWFKLVDLGLVYLSLLGAGGFLAVKIFSPQGCSFVTAKQPQVLLGKNLEKGLAKARDKKFIRSKRPSRLVQSN